MAKGRLAKARNPPTRPAPSPPPRSLKGRELAPPTWPRRSATVREASSKPGTKRMICTLRRWARGDIAAKGQRIADIADRLEATAGAAYDDGALAKDAAEQRLVDIYTLYLVAVHLNRVPGKQAGFVDDSVVGYRKLRRRTTDKGAQRCRECK